MALVLDEKLVEKIVGEVMFRLRPASQPVCADISARRGSPDPAAQPTVGLPKVLPTTGETFCPDGVRGQETRAQRRPMSATTRTARVTAFVTALEYGLGRDRAGWIKWLVTQDTR